MTTAPRRRLLIGAASFADARAALELAQRMAERLADEMGGMLVEETLSAEIAISPRQRIVSFGGELLVAPSPQQARALVEGDARAFRARLARLAAARALKWSFERDTGELVGRLCEAARGWDLLLLGQQSLHRRPGRVVLIEAPGTAGTEARALAEELVRALGTGLLSLSLAEDGAPAEAGHEVFPDTAALLARIARVPAAAVVLDLAHGPLRTQDELRRLLAVARCPILVLGAGQGQPALAHSVHIPPPPD